MGGWIKVEKDLRDDLRVKKIARVLLERWRVDGDAVGSPVIYHLRAAMALTLGALVQLWMHADTFADEANVLHATLEDVDELTGIEGFAQLLPQDWLKVLDAERIEVPGFQEHNGNEAKRLARHAKAQARYRAKMRDGTASLRDNHVTAHSITRPDLDQTETREKNSTARGSAVPNDAALILTPEIREWARANAPNVNPESALAEFCDYWRAIPGARGRKLDWPATFRNRLRESEARYNLQRLRGANGGQARPTAPKPAECKHGLPPTGCVHCREERERARATAGPVAARSVLQDLVDRVKP